MPGKTTSLVMSLLLLACGLSFYPMEKDLVLERQAQQAAERQRVAPPALRQTWDPRLTVAQRTLAGP